MKKRPLLRTRTGLIASGNINSDADPSPSAFRALSEECGHLFGRFRHSVNEILGASEKKALLGKRTWLLASVDLNSDPGQLPDGFRALSEGLGIYLGGSTVAR